MRLRAAHAAVTVETNPAPEEACQAIVCGTQDVS